MSNYTFISPIKANRDAVEAKLKAKGGITASKTMKVYCIKDKDGNLLEQAEAAPEQEKLKDGKTCDEVEVYIVESDVKP